MSKYLVISTSGNPDSNSRRMARIAHAHLEKLGVAPEWLDLREMDLPLCDADVCYNAPGAQAPRLARAAEFSWSRIAAMYRQFFRDVIMRRRPALG